MARNSRRSNGTGDAPVAVTATVGASGDGDNIAKDTVDELRDRLVELQSTVEQLVSNARLEPATGDAEVDSAARTLRFAQQTADSVIAEAREEAAAIVADAERQRSEIIHRARQQADQDYTSERDRVTTASTAWQDQRTEVLTLLESLTEVFGKYRSGLAELDDAVEHVTGQLREGGAAEAVVVEEAPEADDSEAEAAVEVEAEAEDAVIDLTEVADGTEEPATGATITEIHPVDAEVDPFVFDPEDLPATTGNFGWETDEPASGTF